MRKLGLMVMMFMLLLGGCSAQQEETIEETEKVEEAESTVLDKESIRIDETMSSSNDGEHVIEADGESLAYSNVQIVKSGDSEAGDEADFYGDNAAVYARNGAALTLKEVVISTDGKHANALFSYGEGTSVTIADSYIETSGNCSGGLMTTGGGQMNAENLNIHTSGNSSAAIRSDRGGGIVNVDGGSYVTEGTGSPVIYSTADITVSNAYLQSTASQGVVVEGRNSVTLNDCELVASNTKKNSDKSAYYQAVMIYQSMSGDADEGQASFTMNGGTLSNSNGDIFFVNNTSAEITLDNVTISDEDSEGLFLRAAAAGWGKEGSNGGQVTLNCYNQQIEYDILVDELSSLNLYLNDGSLFKGTIDNEGNVYVELSGSSRWILSEDCQIDSLSCEADSIDLNGYKLYVNGEEYEAGTAVEGEPVSSKKSSEKASSSSTHSNSDKDKDKPNKRP